MPEKPNNNLACAIFIFFILSGLASFTQSNTSFWFKILMGITVLLSTYGLCEKVYFHFKQK